MASKHQRALALHLHDEKFMADDVIEGFQSAASDRLSAGGCLLANSVGRGDIGPGADPGGANPAMAPPKSLEGGAIMSFGPPQNKVVVCVK